MVELLSKLPKGLCFIVSAPAGTGKTTLVGMLTREFPEVISSISFTTRAPRTGEINGRDYHFISEAAFDAKISAGDFLECVTLYGYRYGTSRQWISEQQAAGKHVVLVIDTQGAKQLMGKGIGVFIFIRPPSLDTLRQRLTKRNTEAVEMMEKRLAWAALEMEAAPLYDYQIINDELDTAYQVLRSIVISETHRNRSRNAEG